MKHNTCGSSSHLRLDGSDFSAHISKVMFGSFSAKQQHGIESAG